MGGGGTPCGACKFLRRKCAKSCVFAPYFSSDEMGTRNFGTIHKVFGASNFSKLLMDLPVQKRYDAVVSVLYEAEARLQDPVYGCVSHIYALQQQVAHLKEKLSASYAQVAACGSSDGALLVLEYGYGIQSEMPSLISNSNSGSRYDKQHFSRWGDLQYIASEDVQMNNYNGKAREDEGSWRSTFSMCMQGNNSMTSNHAVSTSQEPDVVQDADRLSEQRRPISDDDRDLQDLVLAVLRRNTTSQPV